MQSGVHSIFDRNTRLRKIFIGIKLNCQQVGQIHDIWQLAKILADTFLLSEGVSHLYSSGLSYLGVNNFESILKIVLLVNSHAYKQERAEGFYPFSPA